MKNQTFISNQWTVAIMRWSIHEKAHIFDGGDGVPRRGPSSVQDWHKRDFPYWSFLVRLSVWKLCDWRLSFPFPKGLRHFSNAKCPPLKEKPSNYRVTRVTTSEDHWFSISNSQVWGNERLRLKLLFFFFSLLDDYTNVQAQNFCRTFDIRNKGKKKDTCQKCYWAPKCGAHLHIRFKAGWVLDEHGWIGPGFGRPQNEPFMGRW